MAEKISRGLFITFEGPEGSGKTTQIRKLAKELANEGYPVVETLEPGDTELGKRIRDILLQKDSVDISPVTELLLFEADRRQHIEERIEPSLREGSIVLCDRFNTATLAYQGYGLEMDIDLVNQVDNAATGGLEPDLIILLDIDVVEGLKRAVKENAPDRMEKRRVEFHRKVRKGYLEMASKAPEKFRVVDASQSVDDTYRYIRQYVYEIVKGHKRAG
jgi:dTMP kinase